MGACSIDDAPPVFGGSQPTDDASADPLVRDAGSSGQTVDAGDDPDYRQRRDVVTVDGLEQRFLVVEPRRASSAKLPIVVMYHGDTGTAQGFQQQWQFERAAGQGALLIYPDDEGKPSAWGGGEMHTGSKYSQAFLRMVKRAVQVYRGDVTKVIVGGHSAGGIFAGLLGCEFSGSAEINLRAVVTMSGSAPNQTQVDGSWPETQIPKCAGQRALPSLVIHGKADTTQGVSFTPEGLWVADYWTFANRNALAWGGQNEYGESAPKTPIAGLPVPCMKYEESPPQAPVVFCAIDGLGHTVWNQAGAALWSFADLSVP